jgi:glycosyltransferase involved in cell wall biosynthesis
MEYKYNLSVCLCIKNEAKYMPEFIDHYIKQGVEHFYIVSNNSTDNIKEVINCSAYANLITFIVDNRDMGILINNSSPIGHKELLDKHFYPLVIKETKWAIFIDADEFMFGKNGYTIKSYLDEVDDHIGCIYVIWTIINPLINSDGIISNEFSTKQNLKRLNYNFINNLSWLIKNANDFGKSIVRTSMLSEQNKLWLHKIYSTGTTINNYNCIINSNYDNCNNISLSEENYAKLKISLNHYAIRNYDDYIKKEKQLTAVSDKKAFIDGLFEMLRLSDEYLVTDDTFLNL